MPSWRSNRCLRRSSFRARPLRSALALSAIVGLSFGTATAARAAYQIPSTIAGDCSADVTAAIGRWIASVPDNSVLSFGPGACYRIEGTLEVADRNGLLFEGNGATFKATIPGTLASRSQWRFVEGSRLRLRRMTIQGANPRPGTFTSSLQHQHGIDVRGTAVVGVDDVDIVSPYGDCIYLGRPWGASGSWSVGVHVRESSCVGPGRNGVAVTAARDVVVETSRFAQVGLNAFDVEPNGTGYGGVNLTFRSNEVGSVSRSIFAALGQGTVDRVTVSYNTVVGRGLYLAAIAPTARRFSNIRILGNSSDTGHNAPGSVAMDFVRIDGLTVTGNTVPLSGRTMALADVSESCNVNVSGNRFPGGVAEARIHAYPCSDEASAASAGGPAAAGTSARGAYRARLRSAHALVAPAGYTYRGDSVRASIRAASARPGLRQRYRVCVRRDRRVACVRRAIRGSAWNTWTVRMLGSWVGYENGRYTGRVRFDWYVNGRRVASKTIRVLRR
jgi:hypothetical protein